MDTTLVNYAATADELRLLEESVICCLLLDTTLMVSIRPVLATGMFITPELDFAYQAMCSLYDRGEQPDLVTLEAEMRRLDAARTREMDGVNCLRDGLLQVHHTANALPYAREVRRYYLLRLMQGMFDQLHARALQPATDPASLIADAEQQLTGLREKLATGKAVQSIGQIANEVLDYHRECMEGKENRRRILTGLDEFDDITGGLFGGEVFVVGGRPGDGKSAVALQIAANVALSGKHVYLSSQEMTPLQIINRHFAGFAGVDARNLRVSKLSEDQLGRMEQLAADWQQLPYWVDYTASNTVDNIRAQVMLLVKRGECDLVIVDYLHMLDLQPGYHETMEQMVARAIRGLKRIAIEANCPVLVVSQLNRNSEARADKAFIPLVTDLRDSGTIEQVADGIAFIYRPDRHGITQDPNTGESLQGIAHLLVQKQRNGPTGVARIRFNRSFTRLRGYRDKDTGELPFEEESV